MSIRDWEHRGGWLSQWIVIGYETACGDPIFALDERPNPVCTDMHGEGFWNPKMIAPSLEALAHCLRGFQEFAARGSSLPTPEEQAQFLMVIRSLTKGDQDALSFWAVRIDVDLGTFSWLV